MSHGTDIFIVGLNQRPALLMLEKYPEASVEKTEKGSWIKLRYSGYKPSELLLTTVLADVEVFWLSISSPTDYFYYLHWNDGEIKRSLLHEEGYWSEVEGAPEAWEELAFFPEDALMEYPSYSRFRGNESNTAGHRAGIETGSYLSISSKDAWNSVVSHYQLT